MPQDHRNRPCRVFQPPLLLILPRDLTRGSGPMPHAVYRRILRHLNPPLTAAAFAALMLAGIAVLIWSALDLPEPAGAKWVAVAGFALLLLALWRYTPRMLWRDWMNAALHEGYCPACGQSLQGVPPHTDHRTRCPECGAAWIVTSEH